MDRQIMFMKINCPQGVVCTYPEFYIYAYDHNIQTPSTLKPLGQSKPNFMWNTVRKGGG